MADAYRCCLLVVLSGLLAGPAVAQADPGIRVHMHGIEGYATDGMLYTPVVKERPGALLLIPDERGITHGVTEAATRFVAAGYVVVVVDLNRGLAPDIATRTDEEVSHDVHAALEFVSSQAHLSPDRVGLVGWGSGGAAALRLAGQTKTRAIAIEGSAPLWLYSHLEPVQASIIGSFAGAATDASMPSPQEVATRLRSLGKPVSVKIYKDAGPGFDDSEDAGHFKPRDIADIRSRELQFFAKPEGLEVKD